jgi:RNA polymerase sigma-70 factor (ECF subfamily)
MDTDRSLMARVAGRDEQAFAELVGLYGPRLYAVAHRLLGSRPDAEDAVQRAFLRCFARASTYRPAWAVSTWLYRILTNICIDEMRRRMARTAVRDSAAEAVAANGAGSSPDPGRRVDLQRALDRVPREARLLLTLRYVDGLSYGELARVRGISVNTVKSQLARGKSILRTTLLRGGSRARDKEGNA